MRIPSHSSTRSFLPPTNIFDSTAEIDIGTTVGAVSASNEARALDEMARAMREVLSVYARSIEEDDALLASPTLEPFSNERNAAIVTRGEKEIARFWIRLAEEFAPLLRDLSPAERDVAVHTRGADASEDDDVWSMIIELNRELAYEGL